MDNEIVSLPIRFESIKEVSEILTFELTLLDNEIVSLPIRFESIKEVSEILTFDNVERILELFNISILLDNEIVSEAILSETY